MGKSCSPIKYFICFCIDWSNYIILANLFQITFVTPFVALCLSDIFKTLRMPSFKKNWISKNCFSVLWVEKRETEKYGVQNQGSSDEL